MSDRLLRNGSDEDEELDNRFPFLLEGLTEGTL
jgi:hypothetical protein